MDHRPSLLSLSLTLTLSQHLAVDNVSRAAAPSSMRSSDLAMTWQNRPPPSTICLYAFWLCFVRRPPCLIVSPSLAPPRPPHPERNALKLKERLRRSRSPPPRRAWVRSLRLSGPPRKRTRRRGVRCGVSRSLSPAVENCGADPWHSCRSGHCFHGFPVNARGRRATPASRESRFAVLIFVRAVEDQPRNSNTTGESWTKRGGNREST